MKFGVCLFVLWCGAALAQTASPEAKPPAAVDQALRARVNQFYTFILNHEYRKAEELVADDTKEFYYDGSKPNILHFDLQELKYSDNFTKAVAITKVTQKVMLPVGATATSGLGEWTLPIPSAWKLEKGEWYWYVDQTSIMNPVGKATKVAPGNSAVTVDAKGLPKDIPKTPEFAFGKTTADRKDVTIARGFSDKVTITNGSQGQVQLVILNHPDGVEPKLDKTQLNGGDKAILSLRATKDAKEGVVYVGLMPLGEPIAVQVKLK